MILTSWSQLEGHLRDHHESVDELEPKTLTIAAVDDRGAVSFTLREGVSYDQVVITSFVCEAGSVELGAVTARSSEPGIGHLCALRGAILLRHALPIVELDSDRLDAVIAEISTRAASFFPGA
jgi:hypothetical protein